jgi:hypothetical protein
MTALVITACVVLVAGALYWASARDHDRDRDRDDDHRRKL